MKKITTLLLLCFSIGMASAQNSIGINSVHIPTTISTDNEKLRGAANGVQMDFRIDVTNREIPAVDQLGLKNIILKASFINMGGITQDAKDHIFGKDLNFMVAGGFGKNFTDRTRFFITPEVGLRYSSKDFYNTDNQNMIIGSHVNIVVGIGANMMIDLMHGAGIQFGAEVTHASNMRTQQPNLGVNQLLLTAGLYQSLDANATKIKGFKYDNLKGFEVDLLAGYSGQVKAGYYVNPKNGKGMFPDTIPVQGKTSVMPSALLSISYNYADQGAVNLKFGTDLIYRFKTLDYDHFFQTYQGRYSSYKHLNAGIFAGLGIQVGRVNFSGSEGYLVLADQIKGGKRLYSALEVKLAITKNIGVELRSQLNDFGSAGLTFKF